MYQYVEYLKGSTQYVEYLKGSTH